MSKSMIVCIVIMFHLFHYHENMLLCFSSVLLFFNCGMLCFKYIFIKGVFPEWFLFHNCFIKMKQNLHQFERKQVVLKKLCCHFFLQKTEITALCCEANFAKNLWQKYFQKKKRGHSRMSNFCFGWEGFVIIFKKNAKKPTFYYTKSYNLVIFYRISNFKGVISPKKFPLKSRFREPLEIL